MCCWSPIVSNRPTIGRKRRGHEVIVLSRSRILPRSHRRPREYRGLSRGSGAKRRLIQARRTTRTIPFNASHNNRVSIGGDGELTAEATKISDLGVIDHSVAGTTVHGHSFNCFVFSIGVRREVHQILTIRGYLHSRAGTTVNYARRNVVPRYILAETRRFGGKLGQAPGRTALVRDAPSFAVWQSVRR
jgi:hypothetical protein